MQISVKSLDWLGPILTGLYVAWFVYVFTPPEDDLSAPGAAERMKRLRSRHWFVRYFGVFIRMFGGFFSAIPMDAYREKLKTKLISAGNPGGLGPDEYNGARVVALVLMAICGAFIDSEVGLTPIVTLGLAGLGVVYPDIWLSDLIQKRRRRIFRDLPDFLDMLRLAVDAGLDLSSALKVSVEKGRSGPLLDEMELVERDIALGRTRKEAFRSFADRLGMSEINAFVLALIQADQLGASIGPILKVQAEVARTKRWQLAEVLVNKMPMKMLGPLVVFIFPASFIILFTPLLIQYLQSTE